MQVLFQEKTANAESKPSVSSMGLNKSSCMPKVLPCQEVKVHPKPACKPSLPPDFKVIEMTNVSSELDTLSALRDARVEEFLISFPRCGKKGEDLVMPTWSGTHALISSAVVPCMRVGFMPVIPSPVTDYATVRKALENFQSVRHQLNPTQSLIPIFCDEGVYHTVADLMMDEPDKFSDIHDMMGFFHWTKTLLKCGGRYIQASGVDDGLIEKGIFGKLTLNQVLEGTHYVRSLYGLLLASDLISSLAWEAFWVWGKDHDIAVDEDILRSAEVVRKALSDKQRCSKEFKELCELSPRLAAQFNDFIDECCCKSEVCQYLENFQHIANCIKHAVSSDREGNFPLHMGTVESSLPIFRENDCLNYFRYGSFYIETTKALEATHPDIFRRLMCGYFVIKDHESGCFHAVAPDMKLEQSIQRSSKSAGGIVGQTRNLNFMVEWQLIFHEIILISNNFRDMMHDTSMNHSEVANIHHDLTGSKAVVLHEHVNKLLDFVKGKGNPYVIKAPGIKLQTIVTKQLVNDEVSVRILKLRETGQTLVNAFRKERFVDQSKKLAYTITKRYLPRMDYNPGSPALTASVSITSKMIASAHRDVDIAKERGMSLPDIYSHDLLPVSPIFEGDLPTKPDKSSFIKELERSLNLSTGDMRCPEGNMAIMIDFMSRIRSCPNLAVFRTFGGAVKWALEVHHHSSPTDNTHVAFDRGAKEIWGVIVSNRGNSAD